jgi:hypothetical protein
VWGRFLWQAQSRRRAIEPSKTGRRAGFQQSLKLRTCNNSGISQLAVTLRRMAAFCLPRSRLLEIARVFVRFDQVARIIVNANHGIM